MLLDCSVEFETLCQMIVQKLWQSRNFLGEHTTLVVHSGETCLDAGQRLALKVLLQSLGHEVKYFLPEAKQTEQQVEQKSCSAIASDETAFSTERPGADELHAADCP